MLRSRIEILLILILFTATPLIAAEQGVPSLDDATLSVNLLMQPWFTYTEDGSPDGDSDASQFYFRRIKLCFFGQLSEKFKFFFAPIQTDYGKNSNYGSEFTTVDAWVSYTHDRSLIVDGGFLVVPFLHNFRQSGSSINTIDFHGLILKYPVGSHKYNRDSGVGIRGLLFDDLVGYHVHATRGRWVNDGSLRFTTRLVLNVFEPETGYFYSGTYLGKKKVLSFGVSADMQSDAGLNEDGEVDDYQAIGLDAFLDYPLGKNGITAQINYAHYENSVGGTEADIPISGDGYFVELGYRFGKFEPLIGYDSYTPENASGTEEKDLHYLVGFNYWLKKHSINLKFQYANRKPIGKDWDDSTSSFTFQTQFFFKSGEQTSSASSCSGCVAE